VGISWGWERNNFGSISWLTVRFIEYPAYNNKRCGLSLSVLQQLVILIIKNKLVSDSTSRHSGYEKVSSQEETIHLQVKYISIGCTSALKFYICFSNVKTK